jgi:uncharacterized protein
VRSSAEAKADDQRQVIAFLGRPASYGPGVERVERIETHVSLVFLAGDRAYKLKRAVKLPYLDFSTAQLRREACAAELALNRRTAPSLYLNLRRLGRDAAGRIGFVDDGPALDWVVVMRRFDQRLLFDALARQGKLDGPLMDALADHIARFHEAADRHLDRGGAAEMAELAELQHRCLAAVQGGGLSGERIDGIFENWRERLETITALLDRRGADGKVRRCHGDLHLRNICLLDGKPALFDCLEFSDALATIDVLFDLAFLLMDLEHLGLAQLANRVMNRYLDRTEEDNGLAAMPFFLSMRAATRAHVTATSVSAARGPGAMEDVAAEARRYLELAHRFLRPEPSRLIAIGGLSGAGKSTVAADLAPERGLRPGARLLRSDVARKLMLGVAPEVRLPAEAYTPEITRRVYDRLRQKASSGLAAGYSVIIDAVSLKPDERRSFADVAAKAGAPFTGLWLEASAEAMTGRIGSRSGDASDATPEILAQQLRQELGALDWIRIDAGGRPEDCLAAARRALAAS